MSAFTGNSGTVSTGPQKNSGYVQRLINFTMELGTGTFGNSGANTVKLTDLRSFVSVSRLGAPAASTAEIRIYGVTEDIMNTVSTLGVFVGMGRNNKIIVEAGDTVNGMSVVFVGTIFNAFQNYDGSPEVFLQIIGRAGGYDQLAPAPAVSYPGGADVATIFASLATFRGLAFENNGVSVQMSNVYLSGTAREQCNQLKKQADINMSDDDGTTLAIWPKSGSRGGAIPIISPATGLKGYPSFRDNGMAFTCLFNPNIANMKFGGKIQMQSSLKAASKQWIVNGINFELSSLVTDGPWFCSVNCVQMSGLPAQNP